MKYAQNSFLLQRNLLFRVIVITWASISEKTKTRSSQNKSILHTVCFLFAAFKNMQLMFPFVVCPIKQFINACNGNNLHF